MTIFHITAANSVMTTAPSDDAFKSDTPLADTLIVDAGAYLKTENDSAFGAFLDKTGRSEADSGSAADRRGK